MMRSMLLRWGLAVLIGVAWGAWMPMSGANAESGEGATVVGSLP